MYFLGSVRRLADNGPTFCSYNKSIFATNKQIYVEVGGKKMEKEGKKEGGSGKESRER